MAELTMPSLGADMEAGTLVEWRVQPGDVVRRGQVVAEVETQKGIIEVEIWENGVVDELRVRPGVEVPVGTVLATLHSAVAPPVTASTPVSPAPPPTAPAAIAPRAEAAPGPLPPRAVLDALPGPATVLPPSAAGVAPAIRPASSPSARRLARELEVSLHEVHGSGPHGAITREDVQRAHEQRSRAQRVEAPHVEAPRVEAPHVEAPRVEAPGGEPSRGAPRAPARADAAAMRKAIGAAMARSKREIPHYYLVNDVDVSRAVAWLESENQRRSLNDRILLAVLLLKATALAAASFPELNGHYADGVFQPKSAVHVGVGIALRQGGLVAPALHDVERTPLGELMAQLADLVRRARGGGLRSSELADATITVTNLGEQGTDGVFGIIYPPQVALVGFGKPRLQPWAEGGMLGIRTVVTTTLAADHRVSDGHTGARFLTAIAQRLAEPEKL